MMKRFPGFGHIYAIGKSHALSEMLAGYRGLAVTGHWGPILEDQAPFEPRPTAVPGKTRLARIGLLFDVDSWDGSDLFMAEDRTAFILATERIHQAFLSAALTNFKFYRASEYESVN
jgi:hypothetical protein